MAASGNPKHKVGLKFSTSTLGFFEEIDQYARETIQDRKFEEKT